MSEVLNERSAKRPMQPADVVDMRTVTRIEAAHDGQRAAVIVRGWASVNGRKAAQNELWVADASTKVVSKIEGLPGIPSAAKWRGCTNTLTALLQPIASTDTNRSAIWRVDADAAPERLLSLATDITSYSFNPARPGEAVLITTNPAATRTKRAIQLVTDTRTVVDVSIPPEIRSFRGEPQWSGDGRYIATCVDLAEPRSPCRQHAVWIYQPDAASSSLLPLTRGDVTPLAWSGDSEWLAIVVSPEPKEISANVFVPDLTANFRLLLLNARTGRTIESPDHDLQIMPLRPAWIGSDRIVLVVGTSVFAELFAYDRRTQEYRKMTDRCNVTAMSVSGIGTLFYASSSSLKPQRLFLASEASANEPIEFNGINSDGGEFQLGSSDVVHWTARDGQRLEGVLLKPIEKASDRPAPTLVVVHGGPMDAHFATFKGASKEGGQFWAGRGWAVFYPNPRGSTNYGRNFMAAVVGEWGVKDLLDILDGVDYLIGKGVTDPTRVVISGWSYGGYMAAWAVAQSNRFRAAIVGAGISNLISMYGTTDLPGPIAAYLGGTPWGDRLSVYLDRSPVHKAGAVSAPILIIHGANDTRIPVGQAHEFAKALRDHGKEFELAIYPREGHGFGEYEHAIDRLKRSFVWGSRHAAASNSAGVEGSRDARPSAASSIDTGAPVRISQ